MKILHVITGLDVGGAETTLHRLATTMDPSRFPCRVVSLVAPGEAGRLLERDGVRVHSLGMRRGAPSPAGLVRLAGLLRSYRPDLVQTWLYHADLLGLAARALAFPLGFRPRLVWNIRCAFMDLARYRRTTALTLRACAALSRLPDAVVTNSAAARDFHLGLGYAPRRFEVIANGFDAHRFRPDAEARLAVRAELGLGPDEFVIGHAARFDAMKDHRTFVLAAGRALRELPGAVLVMAGRGVDPGNALLAGWLAEAGLDTGRDGGRVRLLGERADMERVMAAMDLHVLSSIGESLPNVVGEAMACGVPGVVTDVGDSAALVGDTGQVVPPGDPEALARAIIRLGGLDRTALAAMGLAARERVVAGYSPAAAARRYEALYAALCPGPEKSFQ